MPRKVFTAGEVLAAADVNNFLMDQSVMTFADADARTAAIPTPTEGMVTYLADTDAFEFFDGAAFVPFGGGAAPTSFEVESLVVGGGGGGANGGGGGAGGLRNETFLVGDNTLAISIGAGGAIGTTTNRSSSGTNTTFGLVTSAGGGGAGGESTTAANKDGIDGGSGGGGGNPSSTGTGNGGLGNVPTVSPSQGNNGGTGQHTSGVSISGGGGGGSGGVGGNASGRIGGSGGAGTSNSITGSAVTYAVGGIGKHMDATTPPATMVANTGNGGHASLAAVAPVAGNSGVVILKFPTTFTITVGAGLTSTTAVVGDFNITTFTAGSDDVSWAAA